MPTIQDHQCPDQCSTEWKRSGGDAGTRARFEEEANIEWKNRLEEEGAKVLVEIPNMKVHSKICVIRKKTKDNNSILYGFVSTGNLNERTAKVYGDHCLLTSNQKIMADVNRMFNYLEQPKTGMNFLRDCKYIIPSPIYRKERNAAADG